MAPKSAENGEDDKAFLDLLEEGVRDVLRNKRAKASEKVAAISAGAKIVAIRHKLDEEAGGFFK